ncbi:MAG TPA: serine/threonine protein kinase [Clostridiales bacterium]|nr:serine/threonine protein kinase [Clostridiales bacterium]
MQQEIWFQKYKILGLLGRGGTAKVYLAEHIILNSYRAIKYIPKNHPSYELQRNEAFVLKNLKHSGIPIIYDIEENEEGSYIVEQYLEGETLKEYVASRGSLREGILLGFGIQLCDLIHYLHSLEPPILYVDLKPDNIILSDMTLKLVDFGSAIPRDTAGNHPGYYATVGYAAPELYSKMKVDERCDVFGIGMLLYYMATGCYIRSDSPSIPNIDLVAGCSVQLKHIINRCLKSNPAGRYASVDKLAVQLSALRKKGQFEQESCRTVKIAVAGTQPRIGVTHLSLRLCNYYIGKNVSILYQEMNQSGCVIALKNRYGKVAVESGIRIINKIPMYAYRKEALTELPHYPVIVQDFGSLTKENLEEYLSADQKLLILGTKDWELDHSENVLKLVTEYKEIFYLFNFTDGKQFRQVMKSMDCKDSYRIPYEPDSFAPVKAEQELELFREILPEVRRLPWYTRIYNLIKRGWR